MSAITIENDLVHYEVLGRGRPVILVHGWLGSWRYWIPAMQQLSMKYRTYALDLWGFGDSGKDVQHFGFASQVALLDAFMEKMGIAKVALVGHGLGAAVAIRYATQHPDRVPRLMVVCPPLFRMAPPINPLTANPTPANQLPQPADTPSGTVPQMPELAPPDVQTESETMPVKSEEMRKRIEAALAARAKEAGSAPKSPREAATPPTDQPATEEAATGKTAQPHVPALPEALSDVPVMPKMEFQPEVQVQQANPLKEHLGTLDPLALLEKHVEAGPDLDKLKTEVTKADRRVIALSVESYAGVDTLRELYALPMPTLAVHGANDSFLPPPDAEMSTQLKGARPNFNLIVFPNNRHFPMLESIAPFTRLVLDFLEAPDVSKITIKETWERRVR
ncbi:MAG: alpha/beta fold hydrolase [Chloroflexi bacterium]|nr:alpha/beta fold hydrolase [Chloroflexota bacterium]